MRKIVASMRPSCAVVFLTGNADDPLFRRFQFLIQEFS